MATLPTFAPNWAAIAQILGGALAAPEGQYAQGAQQGAQAYQGMQDARLNQQYRQQQLEMQKQQAQRQQAEDAARLKQEQDYRNLFGPQTAAPNGMSQAQFGGAPQTASPFANLTPEKRAFLMAAGPQVGFDLLGQQMFSEPDKFKPNVEEFYVDGKKVKGYLDENRQLVRVGDEVPLYKPEGAGIQLDTNGDGVPDITIGGGGMKPLSDATSQMTLRATMIDDAQKSLAEINFDNVSAGKSAVGGWMSENPVGEAVAGKFVLNDDEKKLLGAQAMIQEATISAITGAAYTEEQKRNMRAAMVPLATDSPSRKMEKLKSAAQFLRQLDKNSGYNRIVEPTAPATPSAPSSPPSGGTDYKSKYGLE
jgi:hypothetical protein